MKNISDTAERVFKLSLAVSVISLYVVLVAAVFVGFASYTYRSEWTSQITSSQNGYQTLDALMFDVRTIEALETQKRSLLNGNNIPAARLIKAKQMLHAAKGSVTSYEADAREWASETLETIRGALRFLNNQDAQIWRNKIQGLSGVDQGFVHENLQTFERDLRLTENEETDHSDALTTIADLTQRQKKFTADGYDRLLAEVETLEGKVLEYEHALGPVNVQLENLQGHLETYSDRRNIINAAQSRLSSLELGVPVFGSIFVVFVGFPTIFLTLIVTIAAGGLGAVVAFSRGYRSGQLQPKTSLFFVSVGEGVAAAIAIFLLSGAGMLALTQGSGAQSSVQLSPYTVAFIAFVSGFMSEDAFAKVRSAGKKVLSDIPSNSRSNAKGETLDS